MKKIFCTLLMLSIMLTSAVAMAAFEETISEDADITAINSLAVALPKHYRMEASEPSVADFIKIIFDAGKTSKHKIVSYREVTREIMNSTGIDVNALQDANARKVYNDHVAKYADAYIVVTTANNLKKTQFFFEVYDSNTQKLLYLLTVQSRNYGKDNKGYTKACEEFYQRFDEAVEKTIKDAAKQEKKAKKNKK